MCADTTMQQSVTAQVSRMTLVHRRSDDNGGEVRSASDGAMTTTIAMLGKDDNVCHGVVFSEVIRSCMISVLHLTC